ncbi:hypothetical protein GO986_08570 [Deinococcus sp. HMF7620]|uniref:Uncharacterized protein n=1 Tax=Deinococcus arboris TaxID=2682977 RepID=A0A7C9HZA2_9DEIO|nr:hypothetical protein [Deinococcus arboris]MVN86815.1 hypothetical protein [Deinococcus arboris]
MDQHEKHLLRTTAPEAALGEPNPDFSELYGAVLVPYLAPSWREMSLVRALHELDLGDQAAVIYSLVQRRLPTLTFEQFCELTGPDGFTDWWQANRPPRDAEGGDSRPPSTGRGRSAPSPWSVLLSGGTTPPSIKSSPP